VNRSKRLFLEPLKSGVLEPPEGGTLFDLSAVPQLHLFVLLIFRLLRPDVLPDGGFVCPDGRDKVATRPEILSSKVPRLPHKGPRDVDGTLTFDVPHHLTNRILGRYRQQHVDMVDQKVAFHDFAFPLFGKILKHVAKMIS